MLTTKTQVTACGPVKSFKPLNVKTKNVKVFNWCLRVNVTSTVIWKIHTNCYFSLLYAPNVKKSDFHKIVHCNILQIFYSYESEAEQGENEQHAYLGVVYPQKWKKDIKFDIGKYIIWTQDAYMITALARRVQCVHEIEDMYPPGIFQKQGFDSTTAGPLLGLMYTWENSKLLFQN